MLLDRYQKTRKTPPTAECGVQNKNKKINEKVKNEFMNTS